MVVAMVAWRWSVVVAVVVPVASSCLAEPSSVVSARLLCKPCGSLLFLPSLRINTKNYNLYLVFGRFPAELGPETRSNGSGSKHGSEPRKPILRTFRDHFLVRTQLKI